MGRPRLSLRLLLLVMIAVSLLSAASARADGAAVSLSGRALDPAGLPIPEARVTAVAVGHAAPETAAVSGPDGRFTLALAAGVYDLRVELEGFAETVQRV